MIEFESLKQRISLKPLELVVATGSMEPLIKVGDRVKVGPCDPERLSIFDIIVFLEGEKLICHYVIHLNQLPDAHGERLFVTRGLDTARDDLPVQASSVLGVVLNYRLPWYSRLRIALARRYGWRH